MTSRATVVCRNNKTGEEKEVPVDSLQFRPAAYGVLLHNDAVLLCPMWDRYDFPGGGVDLGDSLKATLIREFKEETGLAIEVGKLLDVQERFFMPAGMPNTYFHALSFYYHCKNPIGELSTDFLEGDENNYMKLAEWVSVAMIDSTPFLHAERPLELIERARL